MCDRISCLRSYFNNFSTLLQEISILFDYKQEHTILYRGWLDDMDVELLPTEPRTVTTALGRPVETRQIAIIPLQPTKKEGEPVVIGAWVVESATWSKGSAPMIKNLRKRFVARPTIPKLIQPGSHG